MPFSFFSMLRLAGMNISFVLILLAVGGFALIIGWRVALAICATVLIGVLSIFVWAGKLLGMETRPLTNEQRLATEAVGASIASALTICNGGRHGGRRRLVLAIKARGRLP